MKREICFSLRFGLDIPICVELLFVPPEVDDGLLGSLIIGEAALNANNGCCVLFLVLVDFTCFLCDLLVVGIVVLLFLVVLDG